MGSSMNVLKLSIALLGLANGFDQSDSGIVITANSPARISNTSVQYFLTGTFGGIGGTLSGNERTAALTIPVMYNHVPAARIKAVVYSPGCQMKLLDINGSGNPPRRVVFSCSPLPSILQHFAIAGWNPDQMSDEVVKVQYLGCWASRFLGYLDGPVMTLPIEQIEPHRDGTFATEIPDFAADPTWQKGGSDACLQIVVLSRKSGNLVSMLLPLERSGTCPPYGIAVASSYPDNLTLTFPR